MFVGSQRRLGLAQVQLIQHAQVAPRGSIVWLPGDTRLIALLSRRQLACPPLHQAARYLDGTARGRRRPQQRLYSAFKIPCSLLGNGQVKQRCVDRWLTRRRNLELRDGFRECTALICIDSAGERGARRGGQNTSLAVTRQIRW